MQKFIFTYRPPKGTTPGGDDVMAAWRAWFDGLGANLVEYGNPVFERSQVGNCSDNTVLGGYSIVTADDLESALALAKSNPAVARGGGVEVGVLTELPR
jgi:hypothetical protein